MKNIIYILILLIGLVSWKPESPKRKSSTVNLDTSKLEKSILDEINDYRGTYNLKPIKFDKNVYAVTSKHTYYMSEMGFISHDEPEDLEDHIEVCGDDRLASLHSTKNGKPLRAFENVLVMKITTLDEREIIDCIIEYGWVLSAEHNEALLAPALSKKYSKLYGAISCKRGGRLNSSSNNWLYVTFNFVDEGFVN